MGGGDLNMKKSWHTGTFQNQERVWKREQEALAERKKTQQLQKELEQERAVQELQRLQAEAGGGRREERVEWLYAAPAEGNGPNAEELESYLLGKKRVDKLLKGNEEKLMAEANSSNAPGSGQFTASSTANTARDTAAKIREDPLLAIKRQEQLQYEKMMKDPKRLKELRRAKEVGTPGRSSGGDSKEERRAMRDAKRKEREERRANGGGHSSHHHRSERRGGDRDRSRSRSPPPRRRRGEDDRYDSSRRRDEDDHERRPRSRYEDEDRHRRGDSRYESRHDDRPLPPPRRRSPSPRRRSPSPRRRSPPAPRIDQNQRPHHHSSSSSRPPPPPSQSSSNNAPSVQSSEERQALLAARLASMQSSAQSLSTSRAARLTAQDSLDAIEAEKEEKRLRENKGLGPRFMRDVEKGVFDGKGGLGERIRRSGKVGMVGDRD